MITLKISRSIHINLYISFLIFLSIFFNSCDSDNLPIDTGAIGYSTDSGETWTVYESPYTNFGNLESLDSGKTISVISSSGLMSSSNNGYSFSIINDIGIYILPTGIINCGVKLTYEKLYHTDDNCHNFNDIYYAQQVSFDGGDIDSQSGLGIITGGKKIFKSMDYGIHWDSQRVSEQWRNVYYKGVDVVNSHLIYLIGRDYGTPGQNSLLFKSTDAGMNWTESIISDTIINYYNLVSFFNENIGIINGTLQNGSMLRTTDGGNTWIECGPQIYAGFREAAFSGSTYFGIEGNSVYRSTDFGETWNTFRPGAIGSLSSVYSPSPGILFVSGYVNFTVL